VAVAAETMGRVVGTSLAVGSYRPAGSLLVRLDDELRVTGVRMAEITLDKARRDLERMQMVQTENAIPEQQIDAGKYQVQSAEAQVVTARRQLRDTRIVAPFGGVIATKNTEVGALLQPGTVVATLVDVSVLKVKLNVSERDLQDVRVGDAVEVTSDIHPGIVYTGTVGTIGARADEAHTYAVEVAMRNNDRYQLKPGMFARVRFTSVPTQRSLVIPRTALVGSVKQPEVYVVRNNTVYRRSIMIGGEAGTDVVVLKGLLAGDEVVVGGQNNLRDSMAVEVVK
jgi:RND family efflux transporter MFP subunit